MDSRSLLRKHRFIHLFARLTKMKIYDGFDTVINNNNSIDRSPPSPRTRGS
jgi:hypothetical protein